MELFDARLFDYRHPLLLLYGKESHSRAYEPFHWLEPGWSKAFRKVPEVHWLPGSHGQFFLKENVSFLAERVRVFLNGNE